MICPANTNGYGLNYDFYSLNKSLYIENSQSKCKFRKYSLAGKRSGFLAREICIALSSCKTMGKLLILFLTQLTHL